MNSVIYPELNETTQAQIEYKCSFGGKLYLTTDVNLKGRGITQVGDGSDHKRGKKTYLATEKAFNALKEKYTTTYIALL